MKLVKTLNGFYLNLQEALEIFPAEYEGQIVVTAIFNEIKNQEGFEIAPLAGFKNEIQANEYIENILKEI